MDARVRIIAVGLPQAVEQRLLRFRRQLIVLELAQAQQQRPPGRDVLLRRVVLQKHVRLDTHIRKATAKVGAYTAQAGIWAFAQQGPEAVGADGRARVQRPTLAVPLLELEQDYGRMGLAPREVSEGLVVSRAPPVQRYHPPEPAPHRCRQAAARPVRTPPAPGSAGPAQPRAARAWSWFLASLGLS